MCIGQALRVVRPDGVHAAWCDGGGPGPGHEAGAAADAQPDTAPTSPTWQRVDLTLVGPQPRGAWVLVFNGAARRVLPAGEAAQTVAAHAALAAALAGRTDVDAFFADLAGRTPELPAHLRPLPQPTPR